MEDGGGECGGEAKVAPPTAEFEDFEDDFEDDFDVLKHFYVISQGNPWSEYPEFNGEARYSSFYRDHLSDTVKSEFFKAPVKNLDSFCLSHDPDASFLRDLLADAVMFFKLHNTWQVYICPSCDSLRWFPSEDSLVLHLMYMHRHAFPFLPQNPTKEQSCPAALPSTIWKLIDVRAALDELSTLNCIFHTNHFGSLEWPLYNDCTRSTLLARLLKGFEMLLDSHEGESFTVRSAACLQALIAVASEHILRHLDPTNLLPPPFISLFYRSPLSFLLMEVDSLDLFLSLVEEMCCSTQASQNRKLEGGQLDDFNCSKSECPDAVFFSVDCDCFFLDGAKLNCPGAAHEEDMGSWLFKAPYFPEIQKLPVPTKASQITLQLAEKKAVLFSECLRTVHAHSDLKLLTSCLKILNMEHWSMPLLDTKSPESASNSESDAANVKDMLAPSHIFREPSKRQRTEFGCQVYLKLIGLAWELHFFELQVRRLCAVDLRDHILLPLLKSFFRMKLFLSIRIETVFGPGRAKEEDAGEGNNIMEWSREEHPAERVLSRVEGEPAAVNGSNMKTPEMSSCKRSEEVSTTPAELGSCGSSAISVSDVDPTMIDAPCAGTGNSADTDLSRNRTGMAAAIAESEANSEPNSEANSEAIPESDAEHESEAELESQQPEDVDHFCWFFDTVPDCDRLYESEVQFEDVGIENEFPEQDFVEKEEFSTVFWLMREKCAWQDKNDGLFVCVTINDVVKHCLENKLGLETAQNIFGWKTSRSLKYWHCFACKKRFPDQKSHMVHLGLSWDNDWSVPIQVQQEGQSRVNEDFKERMECLDDSITVDCTYRRFIVEIGKFKSSYQYEEEGCIENNSQLQQIFGHKLEEISSLEDMCAKSKLCLPYEVGEEDAEMVPYFAKAESRMMLKQCLSNFCMSDYKIEILPSVRSFMQEHMDMFQSRPLQRLDELLRGVSCPWLFLPDSFSIVLESHGKVIINIEEYDGGITFAYLGIRLKFAGDVPFKEPMKIEGTFMYSGISDSDGRFYHSSQAILDKEIKITNKMFYFRDTLERGLYSNLEDKLLEYQAEMRRELQKV